MGILKDYLNDKSKETVSKVTNESVKESNEYTGKITKLNLDKGWGFISSHDIPFTRIFFHWSALKQDTLKFPELKKGMRVSFQKNEIEVKGVKSVRAIKISVMK